MSGLNDSQFSMWRAMIALVMADGEEHPAETQFFNQRFEKLNMTEEQKDVLLGDIGSNKPVSDFFEGITEPRDRSMFIMFARQLFWCDGDFSEQEKEIHERLTEQVMSKVDLEKVMHEVDTIAVSFEAENKGSSITDRLDNFMSKIENLL